MPYHLQICPIIYLMLYVCMQCVCKEAVTNSEHFSEKIGDNLWMW